MTSELNIKDKELIEAAERLLDQFFDPDHHFVSAAIRTTGDNIYSALNIKAEMGRASVCAEPIAVGMALSDGESRIQTVVAVRRSRHEHDSETFVISPCGVCLELLTVTPRFNP